MKKARREELFWGGLVALAAVMYLVICVQDVAVGSWLKALLAFAGFSCAGAMALVDFLRLPEKSRRNIGDLKTMLVVVIIAVTIWRHFL